MSKIDWNGCMMMLGSEKTFAYWQDSNIRLDRKDYLATKRFARGFIEIYLHDRLNDGACDLNIVSKSWEAYRNTDFVLSDNALKQLTLADFSDKAITEALQALNKVIAFEAVDVLEEWARRFFRSKFDTIVEIAERLQFLLNFESNKFEQVTISTLSLPDDIKTEVKRICNRVRWRRNSLSEHFTIAKQVHRMTLPDEWEMLINDYFFEGARSSYPWVDYANATIEYVCFYRFWMTLRQNVDSRVISSLMDCLKINEDNFPESFFRYNPEDLQRLSDL